MGTVSVGIQLRRFLEMLARGYKVAGIPFQHAIQVKKICVVRRLRKQFAGQRHGGLIFRIEYKHLQINPLSLDIVRIAACQLCCNLVRL